MSYVKADHVLPADLLEKVQEYVDGTYIYIPQSPGKRMAWGSKTDTRTELEQRNRQIYADYLEGCGLEALSETYFLSLKSIQRIVAQYKKKHET